MKKPISIIITDTHLSESTIELNKSIFRQAIELAHSYGLKEIDHAGDIFRSRKSQSQPVLTAFGEILDMLLDSGIKLHALPGNHDKTAYSEADSFLDPFRYHPALMLYRFCGARFVGNVGIHYAAFFSDDIYTALIQDIGENGSFEERNVLITHIDLNGAVMNNGAKMENGVKEDVFAKFDRVFIGHYHDPQEYGNIEYIGATLQHNFGESPIKGATILYDDLSTEVVPFSFPQYISYEVDVKDMTTKDIRDLKEEKEKSSNYLRLILKGEEKDLNAFNVQSLREIGVTVQRKQETIEIKELEARAEAFDSKSLTEEFKVFCEKNKLSLKDGMRYFTKIAI